MHEQHDYWPSLSDCNVRDDHVFVKFIYKILGINHMNISEIDLNLLYSLKILLEEKNISRAAKLCRVTQPAMSNTLARIRSSLGDPILVKAGREMHLSPRAAEIYEPLCSALDQLQSSVLTPTSFDPKTDEYHFKLSFHDYEQMVIYKAILQKILENYPNVTIENIRPDSVHPLEKLRSGVVDFSSGPVTNDSTQVFRSELFKDDFVCLVSERFANKIGKSMSLEKYINYEHVYIAPHGGRVAQVDKTLTRKGLKRSLRLTIAEFSMIPLVLCNSELVATLPRRAAKIFQSSHSDLRIFRSPIKVDPITIYLTWHQKHNSSNPHRWLREFLKKELAGT